MERQEIENKIKEFGFEGTQDYPFKYEEGAILYSFPIESSQSCDVIINGTDLYADKIHYLKFEVDNYGISIRLYCGNQYIGCIIESWENIDTFELTRTTM